MALDLTPLPVHRLYMDALRVRAVLESHDWPSVPVVNVSGVPIDSVIGDLEKRWFEHSWMLSYHDYGAVLNMRRPNGVDGEGRQKQLHCRARVLSNGDLQFACHTEYSPIQQPSLHIKGTDLSWSDGQSVFLDVLGGIDTIPSDGVTKSHT